MTSPPLAGVSIRPATSEDVPRCAEIYLESRRAAFHWVPPETFRTEDFSRATEGEEVWVAECGGEVVGFVSIWLPDHFIHNLFLDPRRRGRGFGRHLLAHALSRIGRPAGLKCAVANEPACRFYERHGWVADGGGEDGQTGPWIFYRKRD